MIELLVWLKENNWHVYKDGLWYCLNEKDYIHGKSRKYYTEQQVINKFKTQEIA